MGKKWGNFKYLKNEIADNLLVISDINSGNSVILTGTEFLRRFAMHILPRGFVKIRYFGILSSVYNEQVKSLKSEPDIFQFTETR